MIRTATICASVAAFATIALTSPDVSACGGFFCDGSGPTQVNQAAERIVFAEHPDGRVTSVIQILYEGPADRFGWLLPVPGIPEVGLSSDAAFAALQNATNPQYQMTTTVEGECAEEDFINNSPNNFSVDAGAPNENSTNNSGVTVVDSGSAGPYDYVVIQIDGAAGDKAALALEWLETNNYQVTDVGPDLLAPYLDENYNLLAIRLQKSQDAGAVRPIRLTYHDEHPMIPIKLTAVAAVEDMGVMTWLLGSARAVPVNYKALELNDALINWFNPASNYNDVITAAANEASGQGFVTEYAQATSTLGDVIYTQSDADTWAILSSQDWTGSELELIDRVIQDYAWNRFDRFGNPQPWDGLADAFDAAMPQLTSEQRENLLSCGVNCAFQGEVPAGFDIETFLTAVEDFVVAPMRDTQELFDDFPYVTRLYTTMSAHEMTLDPSFDFNPDLADVSNVHNAERIIECHPGVFQWDASWRVELPSGLLVRGTGSNWPIEQDEMMPATLTVSEVGTSGQGTVVRDNEATVRERLELANALVPGPGETGGNGTGGTGGTGGIDETGEMDPIGEKRVGGSGCATAAAEPGGAILLLLGLLGLRRRR